MAHFMAGLFQREKKIMGWAMGMAYFDELVGYTGHCGSLFNKRNGMGLLFSFSSLLFFRPLYNE